MKKTETTKPKLTSIEVRVVDRLLRQIDKKRQKQSRAAFAHEALSEKVAR